MFMVRELTDREIAEIKEDFTTYEVLGYAEDSDDLRYGETLNVVEFVRACFETARVQQKVTPNVQD